MTGRILFITPYSPLPLVNGGAIRTFNIMSGLAERGWRLSLFSLVTSEVPHEQRRILSQMCEALALEWRTIPGWLRYLRLLRDVSSFKAFLGDYFWVRTAGEKVQDWIRRERFDVHFLSHPHMLRYVPEEARVRTVLDSHNAEGLRLKRIATARPLTLRGLACRLQAPAVRNFEQEAVQSLAWTLAVSEKDHAYFQGLGPGRVALMPNGVDLDYYRPRVVLPSEATLLFMGSMWYHANIDAVRHLVRNILPNVQHRDAKLTILGANPTSAVFTDARRAQLATTVTGYVDDVRPYVLASRILVVPLRYGGGTRLKILEALAQGVPVISTAIGCDGLGLTHGQHIIIADDPADFAQWIDRLIEDDSQCEQLAREGRAIVEEQYGWMGIVDRLHDILVQVRDGVAA